MYYQWFNTCDFPVDVNHKGNQLNLQNLAFLNLRPNVRL